ncbi:hypothetical protein [Klebsiella sp. PL-2018]|uniref:hypothetical protein n=1 Tax=Klebsiella sp. PL-2018 TaxID=2851540 RepID=UPI001C21004F|nr:hypothetical protein [Klebsiella sp. PL-2018]QXC99330.1 hypothetical protein MKleb_3830 [Klebsiella sp. PL-2018]
MKDFKIEYVNGELVALDLNGMSLLDNVQGISFKHELGELPVINVTQGYKIAAPEDEPREVTGEVIHADSDHQQPQRRSKRPRYPKRR